MFQNSFEMVLKSSVRRLAASSSTHSSYSRNPTAPLRLWIEEQTNAKRMLNWLPAEVRSRNSLRCLLRTEDSPEERLLQMPVSNFEARRSSTFCAEKGSTQTQPSAIHRNTVMQDEEGCRLRKFVTIRTVCSFRPRMFCITHRDYLGATHMKIAVAIYQRSGIRNQYRRVFPVHFSYI